MSARNPKPVEGARNAGLEEAAQICESWGDQCAGGSGREIVPSGPNKGQMYGQAYYNLAESIRRAMRPVEAALSATPARDGVREAAQSTKEYAEQCARDLLTRLFNEHYGSGEAKWFRHALRRNLEPMLVKELLLFGQFMAAKEQADGQP